MAGSVFEIKINTTDDPSGVKDATLEAMNYTEALGKVAVQEEKMAARKVAKEQLYGLTDAQKKAASSAYLLSVEQEKANRKLDETAPAAGNASMSMTDMWSSVQLAKQYFGVVKGAVDETVGSFVAYTGQVRDLMALSGANADQTSRMIQMADDAQISYEELSKSLEYAANKGLEPNVEMLMRVSEEYLSLQPGLERTTLLMDTFGKKNTEIYKILELGPEAIRANSAAISDKLIVDEAAIQRAVDYAAAEDDLQDSFEGIKMAIGEKLIPVLTDAATAFNTLFSWQDKVRGALKEHATDVVTTSTSYSDYAKEMERAAKQAGYIIRAHGELTTKGGTLIEKNYLLTQSQWEVARASEAAKVQVQGEKTAIDRLNSKTITITTNMVTNSYGQRTVGSAPGRAAGGPVSAGTPYWVGEQGIPELFVPESNGTIVPKNQAGGGGITLNLYYQPTVSLADKFELETKLRPFVENIIRGRA